MESLILSNQGLTNLSMINEELRLSSKTVSYLDLSNNFLEYYNKK